jgi:hypothetical protein
MAISPMKSGEVAMHPQVAMRELDCRTDMQEQFDQRAQRGLATGYLIGDRFPCTKCMAK